MQDVVHDVEIIEKLKILKHKPDAGDPKITPSCISEFTDLQVVHTDGAFYRRNNTCNKIQKGCFP